MTPVPARTTLLISGMKDNRCRELVVAALESVSGVREVHVNLYIAQAFIIHESSCRAVDLLAVLSKAGYGAEIVIDVGVHGVE